MQFLTLTFSITLLGYITSAITAPAQQQQGSRVISANDKFSKRDKYPFTTYFWPFPLAPDDGATKNGPLPMQKLLMSMVAYPTSAVETPTPSRNQMLSIVSERIHGATLIPTALPTVTAPPVGNTDTSLNINPSVSYAHLHKFAIVATVIGIIGGVSLCIGICKLLSASGLCGRGSSRKVQKSGLKEQPSDRLHLTWIVQPPPEDEHPTDLEKDGSPGEEVFEHVEDRIIDIKREGSALNNGTSASAFTGSKQTPLKYARDSVYPHGMRIPAPAELFDKPDHGDEQLQASQRSSKSSYTTCTTYKSVHQRHDRTKSAPVNGREQRKSTKSTMTTGSEWDIARAYGAPRFDKTKSAGAMSGVSAYSREWNDQGARSSVWTN